MDRLRFVYPLIWQWTLELHLLLTTVNNVPWTRMDKYRFESQLSILYSTYSEVELLDPNSLTFGGGVNF
jgi:hypothetical protein